MTCWNLRRFISLQCLLCKMFVIIEKLTSPTSQRSIHCRSINAESPPAAGLWAPELCSLCPTHTQGECSPPHSLSVLIMCCPLSLRPQSRFAQASVSLKVPSSASVCSFSFENALTESTGQAGREASALHIQPFPTSSWKPFCANLFLKGASLPCKLTCK